MTSALDVFSSLDSSSNRSTKAPLALSSMRSVLAMVFSVEALPRAFPLGRVDPGIRKGVGVSSRHCPKRPVRSGPYIMSVTGYRRALLVRAFLRSTHWLPWTGRPRPLRRTDLVSPHRSAVGDL
jgi:hypothetical protein